VFFVGLLATGLGSAWYHWAPDAAGLVWDRLGMAVTFAGALSLAVAERVGQVPARQALRVLLPLALLSAILPASNGNVLPWAVLQFGGMALVVRLALLKPVAGAIGIRLGVLIGLYALAKLLELGDEAVFRATADAVSGHSLKHLVAALAAWPVIAALAPGRTGGSPDRLRQNAAGRAA
jgi:Na+/phosphate symporter